MTSEPSLLQILRDLLAAAGLSPIEIETVSYFLIQEIVDQFIRGEYQNRDIESLRVRLKFEAPEISAKLNELLRRPEQESTKAKPQIQRKQAHKRKGTKPISKGPQKPRRYVDILISVVGNAIFLALYEAIKYLVHNGWILYSPFLHISHLRTILDMPYDDDFAARLPPSRATQQKTLQGFINVFKEDDNIYTALIIKGSFESEKSARFVDKLTDDSFDMIVARAQTRASELGLHNLPIFYLGMARNFVTPWWGGSRQSCT
jgi:hypothetical protein